MRAMTTTRAGATYCVLRLFYVQGIRSLADYAVVTLVSVSYITKKALETIQNKAMRQLLRALR